MSTENFLFRIIAIVQENLFYVFIVWRFGVFGVGVKLKQNKALVV